MNLAEKDRPKDKPPDPAKKYGTPEKLMGDAAASPDAKRMMLSQWQRDLTLLLTASEENMPPHKPGTAEPPSDSEIAELLQRVSNCLLKLKEENERSKKSQGTAVPPAAEKRGKSEAKQPKPK